ncbi:hypothetical protein REPUB_Repub11eG0023500 [Reevesia pubescens]
MELASFGSHVTTLKSSSSTSSKLLANINWQYSDIGNSFEEDHNTYASRPGIPHGFLLASQTNTPRLTPPGSPPSLSASVSPTKTSKPVSPMRHSISFSTSRGMFDDRSSISSFDSGSQTIKTNHLLSFNDWCIIQLRLIFPLIRLNSARLGGEDIGYSFRRDLKLISEVQAPFRGVRRFFYVAFSAAGISLFFTVPRLLRAIKGGDGAPDFWETAGYAAINIRGLESRLGCWKC